VRAAEAGIPTIIFDWPGHYLGGFNEVERFEDFTAEAHTLFAQAYDRLDGLLNTLSSAQQVIIGGHSLGALMALKALKLPAFQNLKRLGVGVGLGLNEKVETHLFDTEFYQKTLSIRRQLVSPALDTTLMFPWIRDEKKALQISGERIHLIVGEDDMVVGSGGMANFAAHLAALGNNVTTFEPKKLPHHEPTLAAPHLHAFIKQELAL
jgi:predicted esterase